MLSEKLINVLKSAQSVAVLTGAGISAESGVPTFRGDDGLWKKFRPEELANFNAFIRNTEIVWEWYKYRKQLIANVKPNPGHYALVEMENIFPEFAIITQNVDNLHRRAGSKKIFELHGNIQRNYCIGCKKEFSDEIIFSKFEVPKCDVCNDLIRPGVVWFGELLPEDQWNEAEKSTRTCDIFFTIGTSGVVYPAASLPYIAKESGAFVIEINPEPTQITSIVDEFLQGKSGEILPELVKVIKEVR
ncbi:MAG: NAD-dependent protein deacetylase of SIR2 family [Ignavibacteriae bacterium]|nr:MAG: NAD-dependent protein deacetylase of SIR2 family [Ignavibacteriota bacterium]